MDDKKINLFYSEFLNLVIIILGKGTLSSSNIALRAPGAFHHARWMAKAIYCLRIYLFRDQFYLTNQELNNIRDICQFIVRLYQIVHKSLVFLHVLLFLLNLFINHDPSTWPSYVLRIFKVYKSLITLM